MNANEHFDTLVQKTFQEMVDRNPMVATYLGIHTLDHLLPDGSAARVRDDFQWLSKRMAQFQAIDKNSVHENHGLDLELLDHYYHLETFWHEEAPFWQRNPDPLQGIGALIFLQITREFAPLEKRVSDIQHRLAALPRYLKEFKSRIAHPVKLWTQIAVESAERTPSFLDHIVTTTEGRVPKSLHESLAKTVQEANRACKDFEKWLKGLLKDAKDDWALGEKRFERLIALRELGIGVDDIYALGEKSLTDLKEQRTALAHKIEPGLYVDDVTKTIKSHHPKTFKESLPIYQMVMR